MGLLTGRYRRGMTGPLPGSRIARLDARGEEAWTRYATEPTWRTLDALHQVAAETGRTVAQVALRWLLQRPGVTAPIIGARTFEHFEDNLGAAGWSLDDDQLTALTTASERPLPYPYDVLTWARSLT
jgi:aryl-alcohol dehydrogenase-like predicted oxidoreductase